MNPPARTTTTPIEALIVCAICFGWAIYASTTAVLASTHAVAIRAGAGTAGFSDQTFQWIILWEVCFASAALAFLYRRGFAVGTLYATPTATGALIGLALYAACGVANLIVISPFANQWATQPITTMVAEAHFSTAWLIGMAVINGIYEETILLGFLARGLRKHGRSISIGVSLLVRLLYHAYQGPLGMLSILVFGLVLSLYFAKTNKLYPAIFAHIVADIVPFAH